MIFVKTFKGYEDRTHELDDLVNTWIAEHQADVVDIKTAMSHEDNSRAGSGDLIYTLLYNAEKPFENTEYL